MLDLVAAGFDPQAPEPAGPVANDACAAISSTVERARATTRTSSIGPKAWIPRDDDAARSLAEARTYLAGREGTLVLLQWQAVLRGDESIRAENVRLFRVHDHFPGTQNCAWLEIGWNNRHMGIPIAAVVSVCHLDA